MPPECAKRADGARKRYPVRAAATTGARRRFLTRHSAFKLVYCSLPVVGKMTPPPGGMHFDFRMWSRHDRGTSDICFDLESGTEQQRHIELTKAWDATTRTANSAMPKLPRKFLVTFEFKNRRGTMALSHNFERVYGPDTLKIITAAFDNAHECLPAKFKKSEHARRKLALLILRHMEHGERDPSRLAETAVLDFLR